MMNDFSMGNYHETEVDCRFCGEKVVKHKCNKENLGFHIATWKDGIEGTEIICNIENCELNHRCKDVDLDGL